MEHLLEWEDFLNEKSDDLSKLPMKDLLAKINKELDSRLSFDNSTGLFYCLPKPYTAWNSVGRIIKINRNDLIARVTVSPIHYKNFPDKDSRTAEVKVTKSDILPYIKKKVSNGPITNLAGYVAKGGHVD